MDERSMHCVERTPEYLDGLVLAALLRSREIGAQLFDENFVRQNWFEILAYGGFRIMVPGKDLRLAREILVDFRSGALQLVESEADRPTCPACRKHSVQFDHRQRRWVFLAWLLVVASQTLLLMTAAGPIALYFAIELVVVLAMLMPGLLRYVVNNRLRCSQCLHAWRELPSTSFARQQRDAEFALAATSA